MGFAFPPIYSFPPFFTRQVHEPTWLKQRRMWSDLILAYVAETGLYELDLSPKILTLPLFTNPTINRSLSIETLRAVLEAMVAEGDAEWTHGKTKGAGAGPLHETARCLIFWRRPGQWADLIYSHVQAAGLLGSIVTVYELFELEDACECAFYRLPEPLWRRALAVLERAGKAKLFDSEGAANSLELGIKFFG